MHVAERRDQGLRDLTVLYVRLGAKIGDPHAKDSNSFCNTNSARRLSAFVAGHLLARPVPSTSSPKALVDGLPATKIVVMYTP